MTATVKVNSTLPDEFITIAMARHLLFVCLEKRRLCIVHGKLVFRRLLESVDDSRRRRHGEAAWARSFTNGIADNVGKL
jgi:hypothetical protein